MKILFKTIFLFVYFSPGFGHATTLTRNYSAQYTPNEMGILMTDTIGNYHVGDKIKFVGETRSYTVQACSDRFLICTKPFAARHTVIYTIVDFKEGVRGRENLIFGLDFETQEACAAALCRLVSGESEVSYRYRVPLLISADLPGNP